MVNTNDNSIHANSTLYGEKLEEVDKFCYLDATRGGSCETDIRIRLALATSAMVQHTVIYHMEQQTNKLQIKAQSLSCYHIINRNLWMRDMDDKCSHVKKIQVFKINRIGNYSVLHIKRGKQTCSSVT